MSSAISKDTKRSLSILSLVFSAFAFLGAAVMIFVELVEKQQVILSAVKEDALWATYQLDRETLKLINALELAEEVANDDLLEEAKVRFDILYSRVNILAKGQLKEEFVRLPEAQETLFFLQEKLKEVDALLFVENQRPDIDYIILKVNGLLKKTESFVLNVLAFRSKDRVDSRAETLKLFLSLGALLALLTLTMSFIIFMLFRQAKLSLDSYKRAKILTVELQAAVKEAQQASAVKSNFLATMSHEIRTPMNAIIGLTHLVIDSDINEKQKVQLEKIQKSTESLLYIINDILDFTKIESGKMSLEEAAYSLDEVLDYIYYLNRDIASSKGLRFTISRDFSISDFLIGDKVRLQQILINLVSNAIKFTSSGFIEVKVSKKEADFLILEVTDSGIGINKGASVFDAFTQADTSTTRLYGGTGLGLSISKKLVELLGGDIRYDSEIGKGTCFRIRFPYKPDVPLVYSNREHFFVMEDDKAITDLFFSLNLTQISLVQLDEVIDAKNTPIIVSEEWLHLNEKEKKKTLTPFFYDKALVIGMEASSLHRSLVTSLITPKQISEKIQLINHHDGNLKLERKSTLSCLNESVSLVGKKVLLAEDNKINADIAKALLEKMGVLVDWVENGQQAFEQAISDAYDLILMDIRMPIMDGYEASDKIKHILKDKKPPIIALTADTFTMKNHSITERGIDDLLSKPIDPILMLSKMEFWMLNSKISLDSDLCHEKICDEDDFLLPQDKLDSLLGELNFLEGMLLNGDAESGTIIENIVVMFSDVKASNILQKIASDIALCDYDNALAKIQSFKQLVVKYARRDKRP